MDIVLFVVGGYISMGLVAFVTMYSVTFRWVPKMILVWPYYLFKKP